MAKKELTFGSVEEALSRIKEIDLEIADAQNQIAELRVERRGAERELPRLTRKKPATDSVG